jgi:hypothetical protein
MKYWRVQAPWDRLFWVIDDGSSPYIVKDNHAPKATFGTVDRAISAQVDIDARFEFPTWGLTEHYVPPSLDGLITWSSVDFPF